MEKNRQKKRIKPAVLVLILAAAALVLGILPGALVNMGEAIAALLM